MGHELWWVPVRRQPFTYELRAGAALVATVEWIRRNAVLGRWAGGQYWLSSRWEKFWSPRWYIHVQGVALGEPVATLAYRESTLTFADGRYFRWRHPRRQDPIRVGWPETELVRFRWRRANTQVLIQPPAAGLPELPVLLLVGQYQLWHDAQDPS